MRNLPGDRVGYDVVNADGTGLRRLGTGSSVGSSPPKWSPDGTAIVFALSDIFGTDDGVWLVPMKLIGHRKHLAEDASHPAWSPDGSRIAFSRRDGEVVVMDVRSRTGRTVARGNDVRAPLWSRDGRRIAFTAVPDEAPEQDESDPWGLVQLAYREVYVVNTDGTGLRRLTRDQHEDTLVDWLPGGRIAVLNEEAFYVIGAVGTGRRAWSWAGRAG
jgi:TolB protein